MKENKKEQVSIVEVKKQRAQGRNEQLKRNNYHILVGELQWSQSVKAMLEEGRRDKYKQRGK